MYEGYGFLCPSCWMSPTVKEWIPSYNQHEASIGLDTKNQEPMTYAEPCHLHQKEVGCPAFMNCKVKTVRSTSWVRIGKWSCLVSLDHHQLDRLDIWDGDEKIVQWHSLEKSFVRYAEDKDRWATGNRESWKKDAPKIRDTRQNTMGFWCQDHAYHLCKRTTIDIGSHRMVDKVWQHVLPVSVSLWIR